jgi:cyclophilin family peptidyl-prolyl cis-trans isomerase
MKDTYILGFIATLIIIFGALVIIENTRPREETTPMQEFNTNNVSRYNVPPEKVITEGVNYKALVTTDLGTITIDLFEVDAPTTVNNFVFLARDGFYDEVKFHRIIEGFMIQTGDPLGTGAGGPGYTFEDENLPESGVAYTRGVVAMANRGPNTNGSQFFIMHTDMPEGSMAPAYSIFGQIEGDESFATLDAIATVEKEAEGSSIPSEPLFIQSIEIIEE